MLRTYTHLGLSYDSWRNRTLEAMRDKISEYNAAVVKFTVLGDKLKAFRSRHWSHTLYKPEKRIAVQRRLDELAFDYQVEKQAVCSADAVIHIYKDALNTAAMKHYGRRISREVKTAKNAVMLCCALKLFIQHFEQEVREIDSLMESIKTGRP